ncbi:unnamed protein product [Oppiella nova]|uniref:Small-subunit processome Utp12 domain-containing protein n=1 Tax=Oppiella nova TaxID=334625 RepID=A0A7R9LM88_9ACAR|nr:unnamed protein product [Oppiella nova]CAG2164939.1 unnamed protein product [Oppiella nova]
MGITKQYLRWQPGPVFGCIGSQSSGILYLPALTSRHDARERLVVTGVCESAVVWDTKTGEQVLTLTDPQCKSQVTALAANGQTGLVASGHSDGTIRLFDANSGDLKVTFSGHRSHVTALAFDGNGMRLASGGKDTEIVVWDVTAESGLYRMKGHKGVVTKVQFMATHELLVSSSTDTYVKFWDLQTQHCFKTLVGHRSQVWSFAVMSDDRRLISGGSDSELKVWNIVHKVDDPDDFTSRLAALKLKTTGDTNDDDNEEELAEETDVLIVERVGAVMRNSTQRLIDICVDETERLLICAAKDSSVECFKLKTADEIKKSITKRLKRAAKRHLKTGTDDKEQDLEDNSAHLSVQTLTDEIERLEAIKTSGSKVRSCDVLVLKNDIIKVCALLADNSVEMYSFKASAPTAPDLYGGLRLQGHRTDVRAVSISSDSHSIVTVSSDAVKVWNKSSAKCVTTITEGVEYSLCCVFAPGDRYVLVGTKTGKLQVFDINSAQLVHSIDASEDLLPVWSMCLAPGGQGLVTGCEDKLVKFWSFELLLDTVSNTRSLRLECRRTLKMDEGVLCVRVSPNGKFVAASLLDSTVRLFFYDTLKYFLSLYGHKFPVLSMDISSDSQLIATGAADKNVKIWGMDFGDCHKSVFAHDDSVTAVQFVPKTHYLFTAAKDKQMKEWDADNYEKIQVLSGHQSEVWALAVAPNGKFAVTTSHDKTLRLWQKTSEPLVLDEEREEEREKEFDEGLFANEETVIAGESNTETALPSKKTVETLKGAERVIEALDVYRKELVVLREYDEKCKACAARGEPEPSRPIPNPQLMYYKTECPHRFTLEVVKRIKWNELEETLLTLPFNYVIQLLEVLARHLERGWEVELTCRCVCFILRVNFGQIVSTPKLWPTLDQLRRLMNESVADLKDMVGVNTASLRYYHQILDSNEEDMVGVNTASLRYYHQILDSNEEVSLFKEAFNKQADRKRRRTAKNSRTSGAPILTWN